MASECVGESGLVPSSKTALWGSWRSIWGSEDTGLTAAWLKFLFPDFSSPWERQHGWGTGPLALEPDGPV